MVKPAQDDVPWAYVHAFQLAQRGADIEDVGPLLRRAKVDLEQLGRDVVDRARRPGSSRRSWVDIGRALGVSKQAAQKKYG